MKIGCRAICPRAFMNGFFERFFVRSWSILLSVLMALRGALCYAHEGMKKTAKTPARHFVVANMYQSPQQLPPCIRLQNCRLIQPDNTRRYPR